MRQNDSPDGVKIQFSGPTAGYTLRPSSNGAWKLHFDRIPEGLAYAPWSVRTPADIRRSRRQPWGGATARAFTRYSHLFPSKPHPNF